MQHVIKVHEEEECVPVVRQRMGAARLIRINGHSGVGKSKIAKALQKELGWHRVEIDKFVDKEPRGRRKFPEKVKLQELRNHLQHHRGAIILEGIWVDHLVPPETFGLEYKIYMRACFSPEHDDDVRARSKELGTDVYHRAFRPERWADLVVMKIVMPTQFDDC